VIACRRTVTRASKASRASMAACMPLQIRHPFVWVGSRTARCDCLLADYASVCVTKGPASSKACVYTPEITLAACACCWTPFNSGTYFITNGVLGTRYKRFSACAPTQSDLTTKLSALLRPCGGTDIGGRVFCRLSAAPHQSQARSATTCCIAQPPQPTALWYSRVSIAGWPGNQQVCGVTAEEQLSTCAPGPRASVLCASAHVGRAKKESRSELRARKMANRSAHESAVWVSFAASTSSCYSMLVHRQRQQQAACPGAHAGHHNGKSAVDCQLCNGSRVASLLGFVACQHQEC
jgi:hypothetical protein